MHERDDERTGKRPVRVLFFLSTFGGGGAEMHTLRLLQHFDRSDVRPSLAVARRGGSYEARLPEDVALTAFCSGRTRTTVAMALSVPRLRRLIRRVVPDVVCGVMDLGLLTVLAATARLGARPTVVGMLQVAPRELAASVRMGSLILAGARHAYHRADALVSLSEGVKRDLIELNPRLRDRITVIPNAIVDAYLREGSASLVRRSPDYKEVVACGRLTAQKDFPTLLRAVALLKDRVPLRLQLLGEGPDRSELEHLARELGIAERVRFLGFQSNPFSYMASADLFVLSSAFEGFGNVIVEAMACGAPVVSTDCPHGPSEIIRDGVSGLLVPVARPEALAEAMARVLTDPELHRSLQREGLRRAEDFRADNIAHRYASALADAHSSHLRSR